MCLSEVYSKKEREKALKDLPNEFTVWKVLKKNGPGNYETDCMRSPVYAGRVKFKQNVIRVIGIGFSLPSYRGGGHFWMDKQAALVWRIPVKGEVIVPCKIKKAWIVNMGEQDCCRVVVVKKAVFPKYIGKPKKPHCNSPR